VLDAMDDEEDTRDEHDGEQPPTETRRSRASASTSMSTGKPGRKVKTPPDEAATGEDVRDEAHDERPDEEPEEEAGRRGRAGLLTLLASPWLTRALVVLVLAALASWAMLQWYSVSGKEKERQKVSAAAAKFGDVVYSYDPANVQAAIDQNREMMAGDLRTQYVASADSYKQFFAKNKWTWTSKTSKVYLSDIQDTLASAVIVIDINIKMTAGPYSVSGAHFTLGLVKQKGAWKVSSMKAAGSEAATDGQQGSTGGLPTPSGGTGGSKDTKKKN
jgi:Mce-associated membrane protein